MKGSYGKNYTLSSFLFAFLFPWFFLIIFYNLTPLMNICHRFYIIVISFHVYKWNVCKCLAKNYTEHDQIIILGDPEVTANLFCNFVYLSWGLTRCTPPLWFLPFNKKIIHKTSLSFHFFFLRTPPMNFLSKI